ncbi:MAG: type II secretion system protein [Bdellovibrionales bacterium]|jgi:prepilin-type N-terminal cleavage/methylation domain-containing protein|nr:type II secretion system protein [Bdellovibrionales bacterium]
MKHERGFTLIEIMVALLILAGLSVLVAQSIQSGLQNRRKIQLQVSEESLIRDAMRLISSDVSSAFHHRDYIISGYNRILSERKKKAAAAAAPQPTQPGGTTPPAGASETSGAPPLSTPPPLFAKVDVLANATPIPTPVQLTGFNGGSDAMTFTVRNHVRRYQDARESDQARVSYFLRTCSKNSGRKKTSSNCLMRMETIEFSDEFPLEPPDSDDATAVALVHGVQSFKLRYIGVGMTDFLDTWDSAGQGSTSNTKGRFPDAVEVTLSVQDKDNPESKLRSLVWLAPVRNSNNPDESDKEKNGGSPAASQPGSESPASDREGQQ